MEQFKSYPREQDTLLQNALYLIRNLESIMKTETLPHEELISGIITYVHKNNRCSVRQLKVLHDVWKQAAVKKLPGSEEAGLERLGETELLLLQDLQEIYAIFKEQ